MAILTLQPDATAGVDASIVDNNPTGNYGTNVQLFTGFDFGADYNRTLIKFDLSGIPAGSKINSAYIELTVASLQGAPNDPMYAYRVLRDWVEAQVTWNNWKTATAWTSPGADGSGDSEYGGAAAGSVTLSGLAVNGKVQLVMVPGLLEAMIPGGSVTNYGWLLDIPAAFDERVFWDSSDGATASERPKLVVDYTPSGNRLVRYYLDLLAERQVVIDDMGAEIPLSMIRQDNWMELGGILRPSARVVDSLVKDRRMVYLEGVDYRAPGQLGIQGGREDIGQTILARIVRGST